MKIYQIDYETKDGEGRRKFAGSDSEASRLSTQLKADGEAAHRPTREAVDIPTDKIGLIEWLNNNASAA